MTERTPAEILLRRAREGDTEAFWALVRPCERAVYAVAMGITHDSEAAADLAHDVYVRAFSTLGNLRSAAAIGGWLCTMTRNVAHERARHELRHAKAAAAHASNDKVISVPQLLIREEELAAMTAAMEELPEAHRIVLGLKYMSGMKCQEIAETLGIGTEAAKSRLFEARKALRARMAAKAANSPAQTARGEQNVRNDS